MNDAGLLTKTEAAEYLGVSMKTLDRLVKRFDIPRAQLGGIRFKTEWLDQLVQHCRIGTSIEELERKRDALRREVDAIRRRTPA
jgi:excisionase family DNA binding protein